MRRLSWVIGGVALGALGLFLWLRSEGGGRGSRAESRAERAVLEVREPAADLAQAPLELDSGRARVEEAVEEPVTEEGAAQESTAGPRPGGRLSGSIVVVDLDGREYPGESGTLLLTLWNEEFGRGHEVEVRAGNWTMDLPDEEVLGVSVGGVRLGERATVALDADEHRPLPADGWLELRARWPAESLLHVLDQSSRRELAPVLFTELSGWPESECTHPGLAPDQARDLGPSPVRLPTRDDDFGNTTRTVYVTSPGYAWGRIQIDEGRGGERIVELGPGGRLAVELAGSQPIPGTRLRLYGSEYGPLYDQPLDSTLTLIEALPVGDYRLRAELGDYWSGPDVLAEEPVEIVAGALTRATLRLMLLTTAEDVPLEGTLSLAGWELEDFQLTLELLDTARNGRENRHTIQRQAMQPVVPGSTDLFSWHAPPVQPGRYEFEVSPCSHRTVLEVGPAGLLQVVVPPPAEVFVRCRGEGTELEPEGLEVLWYGAIPAGVHGWSHERAEHDEQRGVWRFLAPAGEVTIALGGPGLASTSHTFEVRAGRNDLELVAEPLTGVRVVLRDGTTEIPWDQDLLAFLQPEGEGESFFSWSLDGGSLTLHAPGAGRYRLKVPEIPGYEPVPEAILELERGVVIEHVVELVRVP